MYAVTAFSSCSGRFLPSAKTTDSQRARVRISHFERLLVTGPAVQEALVIAPTPVSLLPALRRGRLCARPAVPMNRRLAQVGRG